MVGLIDYTTIQHCPLGELTALPDPLAGGEGLAAPSPRTQPEGPSIEAF